MRKMINKVVAILLIGCLVWNIPLVDVQATGGEYPVMGEIKIFAGNFAPLNWEFCDGQLLQISDNSELFSIIGTTYGGDGITTFALPDLRGRVPIGKGDGPGLTNYSLGEKVGQSFVTLSEEAIPPHDHGDVTVKINRMSTTLYGEADLGTTSSYVGSNLVLAMGHLNERIYSNEVDLLDESYEHTYMKSDSIVIDGNVDASFFTKDSVNDSLQEIYNMSPALGINYIICTNGLIPSPSGWRTEPYIGEIKMFAGDFIPRGFAACEGQLMSIINNSALFSLIGITYGGDGITNFALPDLRGRMPIGQGQGAGLTNREMGERGGVEENMLTESQLPAHGHTIEETMLSSSTGIGQIKVASNKGNKATAENQVLAMGNRNEMIYTTNTSETKMAEGLVEMTYTDLDLTENMIFGSRENGNQEGLSNMMPSMGITFMIAVTGVYPNRDNPPAMDFYGAVSMFAYSFYTDKGACNGQLIQISQNSTLYSLLGTNYGGDGYTTFGLPDLNGRVPIHVGQGAGLNPVTLGQKLGFETVNLIEANLPAHDHEYYKTIDLNGSGTINETNVVGNTTNPVSSVFARGFRNNRLYSDTENPITDQNVLIDFTFSLDPQETLTGSSGNGTAIDNMQPFNTINYYMTTEGGVYPSRS